MITHDSLPEMIPFKAAFIGVFQYVSEAGYSNCDPGHFREKADFDLEVANCIDETLTALGLAEPEDGAGPWLAELYEWLAEIGVEWPDEDEEDDE